MKDYSTYLVAFNFLQWPCVVVLSLLSLLLTVPSSISFPFDFILSPSTVIWHHTYPETTPRCLLYKEKTKKDPLLYLLRCCTSMPRKNRDINGIRYGIARTKSNKDNIDRNYVIRLRCCIFNQVLCVKVKGVTKIQGERKKKEENISVFSFGFSISFIFSCSVLVFRIQT